MAFLVVRRNGLWITAFFSGRGLRARLLVQAAGWVPEPKIRASKEKIPTAFESLVECRRPGRSTSLVLRNAIRRNAVWISRSSYEPLACVRGVTPQLPFCTETLDPP